MKFLLTHDRRPSPTDTAILRRTAIRDEMMAILDVSIERESAFRKKPRAVLQERERPARDALRVSSAAVAVYAARETGQLPRCAMLRSIGAYIALYNSRSNSTKCPPGGVFWCLPACNTRRGQKNPRMNRRMNAPIQHEQKCTCIATCNYCYEMQRICRDARRHLTEGN
ncbi:hypothetical protein ZHAS_00015334 [Anopheles sinensis]|uniref:Uncharacterized protein n=1 Tax=Anopheles sinensis TaxID=74873 RepID=A0A084WAQ9_ANOSI|nr:hypothetical protein ZHAS_00015334 [Anopheles sinensis]